MENEKKRFVEQELNSDDYKRPVHGAKFLKEAGEIGAVVAAAAFVVVKVAPKLAKSFIGMI
jgi:hypothetical protein